MITYVDTSTLLKLVIEEPGSEQAEVIWRAADALVCVKLGYVEARAALAAAHRARRLTLHQHRAARQSLELLWNQVSLAEVSDGVIARAADLAEELGLRGYDAVHLAVAAELDVVVFSSADRQLCAAAAALGMHVADPTARRSG